MALHTLHELTLNHLGGLKSIHAVYGEPHDQDGIVYITNEQQQSGLFDKGKKLFGEKEM